MSWTYFQSMLIATVMRCSSPRGQPAPYAIPVKKAVSREATNMKMYYINFSKLYRIGNKIFRKFRTLLNFSGKESQPSGRKLVKKQSSWQLQHNTMMLGAVRKKLPISYITSWCYLLTKILRLNKYMRSLREECCIVNKDYTCPPVHRNHPPSSSLLGR